MWLTWSFAWRTLLAMIGAYASIVALTGIPVWISWLKYISFVYYGFNLLLHYEYHGRTIYSCIDPHGATSSGSVMTVQVSATTLLLACDVSHTRLL